MRDYPAFQHAAIRYWEYHRIWYNLVLVPLSFFSYMFTASVTYAGENHETHYGYVLSQFALCAVGANICYSTAYAMEFLFGSDEPTSGWLQFGRMSTFIVGLLFAMLLALIGGRDIAVMEFQKYFKHARLIERDVPTESPRSRQIEF
jgi:hypothetical protein